MGVLDHLTCLLRNLYVGQEETESNMEQLSSSKLRRKYDNVAFCYPGYLTYAKYIIQSAELDEWQTGVKIAGRNNLRYSDYTTLMAKVKQN